MELHRNPPVLDMTPDGEFREPPTPPEPGLLDRILARVGGAALLVAVVSAGLVLAALAILFVGLILPVLLVASLVGAVSIWWRVRRARQQGQPIFVVMRR